MCSFVGYNLFLLKKKVKRKYNNIILPLCNTYMYLRMYLGAYSAP